jgi:cytochrome P450
MTDTATDFDELRFDEASFYLDDPHPVLARLRAEDPVHWYERGDFWVVTRYDDIKAIEANPSVFSSRRVAIMQDLRARREGSPVDLGDARGVMYMDPPEHGAHRKPFSARFTPRSVAEMDHGVRDVVTEVLDGLPDGPFDWISQVAEPVPVLVFAELLGLPRSDGHRMVEWSTTIARLGSGLAGDDEYAVVFEEIMPFLMERIVERQANPTDDLLSLISTVEVDGRPLDDIQKVTWATVLLAAGSETTQSLIGGLAGSFLLEPDQAQIAFDDPSLASATIEEVLRWWTPVVSMARDTNEATQVGETEIAEGDALLLMYPSGNRDEGRFGPEADRFDVRRPEASAHLAFGFGEHFCLGAHLARREGRLLLEELAHRYRALEPAGDAVPRASTLVHTFDELPVTLVQR